MAKPQGHSGTLMALMVDAFSSILTDTSSSKRYMLWAMLVFFSIRELFLFLLSFLFSITAFILRKDTTSLGAEHVAQDNLMESHPMME